MAGIAQALRELVQEVRELVREVRMLRVAVEEMQEIDRPVPGGPAARRLKPFKVWVDKA